MSTGAWIALAASGLYAAFLLWYGGRGRPLTQAEVDRALDELRGRAGPPEQLQLLDDLRAMLLPDDGREFVMANLVRYRERALYPNGQAWSDDPRAADRRYGRLILWPLLRRASLMLFVAPRIGRFIQAPGMPEWHYVALVRYRSRRDFLSFALEIERDDIVLHKWAAIETTQVFPVRPLISLAWVRVTVGLLMAVLAFGLQRAVS
jgi:hypothetical protein